MQLAGGRRSRLRVLGQRPHHGARQRAPEMRGDRLRWPRLLGEMGEEDLLRRAAAERHLAGEQGVDDDSEAVDVARRSSRPPLALLGAHVERGADRVPAGEARVVALEHACEAKVGDLGDRAGEQDVARLEVPVHDPLAVGGIDRRGDSARRLTTSTAGSAPSTAMRSDSAPPSQYSMARYGSPSSVRPKSKTVTVWGCTRAPAARASRRKRAKATGEGKSSGCSTLIATGRSISSCSAR